MLQKVIQCLLSQVLIVLRQVSRKMNMCKREREKERGKEEKQERYKEREGGRGIKRHKVEWKTMQTEILNSRTMVP